jgi:uncharacterized protein (TIGR00290 family)
VKPRVLLSWSTGKDSAWALHVLRSQEVYDVVGLLTTVNSEFGRVAMHAVRRELLDLQAEAVRLPVIEVQIPWPCSDAAYEQALLAGLADAASSLRVSHIAFGDLFLEDVRAYREAQLAQTSLQPLFPLWGLPTAELAKEMVDSGTRAILTCIDPRKLPRSFAGRTFDQDLLNGLPDEIDPCGEKGEFHTFAYAGPMFSNPLNVTVGEVVERDGFVFADLAESIFDGEGALTKEFLKRRGYCCGNQCRNCPYDWAAVPTGASR